ncbi:MAG: 2-oxoglutarate dehydrogenase E1 component [Candidatus Latescibacterota bacterium]|jgi:2-oxoglutarate dehydrogenase E1 component
MTPFDVSQISNVGYIEQLYAQYQADPASVDDGWRAFFAGFDLGADGEVRPAAGSVSTSDPSEDRGAISLVNAYRTWGHMIANLAPMSYTRPPHPSLDLGEYGFSDDDLDRHVGTGGFLGQTDGTLRDLLDKLRQTYCEAIGVEYSDIPFKGQREWLERQMEPTLNRPKFTGEQRKTILFQLLEAEEFEQFLHTKYIGYKRFSVEGADSLIPMLHALIETGGALDVEEMVLGMPHRGRLNVLAHVMRKPYDLMLAEFEGLQVDRSEGSGDVKYHMGFAHDYVTRDDKKVHLGLTPNPSHLELVNPVIEGIVYTKQEMRQDIQHHHVVPLLMHGDASFAGQGIVPETICLSHLEGYDNGGTIHIIVNNQIGFTALPRESRFTSYPTDVAKIVKMPVFHVNGDDPEAVVHTARMAMAYRQAVKNDVLIDMWCYRRYGHNESDDPVFTQPVQYAEIAKHPTVATLYAQRLINENVLGQADVDEMKKSIRNLLETGQAEAKQKGAPASVAPFAGMWQGLGKAGSDRSAKTAISKKKLLEVAQKATTVPDGFNIYRKMQRLLDNRMDMVNGKVPIDWGCAEMLAFGSLVIEGIDVRLAGQDAQRGTFSHRHSVWHDVKNGQLHVPLAHLSEDQGIFTAINTMLSELAVLGFEYGVSYANPHKLTIWEAQFGDFANGAQAIMDQFISSSEAKWQKMSGLVMLLPHGFEGQGPEHSSARLERYQALCAEDNMQVGCPTTPAQYFHLLRRQMLRPFRKPLVLMMPKSLLRHKDSTSTVDDLTKGAFQPVIDDPTNPDPKQVKRVLFCTGKVFFDLMDGRDERGADHVAIVRIEEHYPFPWVETGAIVNKYGETEVCWVQEEPQNMGSWDFMEPKLRKVLENKISVRYIGRRPTAATATGIQKVHQAEQQEIVETSLSV